MCVCVDDDNVFVTHWSVTLQGLSGAVRSVCGTRPAPCTTRERRLSPVKESNAGLPLGENSLTCHFSEIIWETKLIPSCWFFLAASLPSKAILDFLFSHSLFFLTLSTGSSIISNNLYFLSLPSYCFVSSSQSLIHIRLVLSLSSSPWASLLPAVEAAAGSQLCALHYGRAGCDFGSCTPARLARDREHPGWAQPQRLNCFVLDSLCIKLNTNWVHFLPPAPLPPIPL